jgi:hypothetical protein
MKGNMMDEITTKEIARRVRKHDEALATAIESMGDEVGNDLTLMSNLLFGAFVDTVMQMDSEDQVKRFKGARQFITEQIFDAETLGHSSDHMDFQDGHEYGKAIEKVIDDWNAENLGPLVIEPA